MLTQEQEACNYITFRHIEKVRNYLNRVIVNLLNRAEKHDQSKLESPEVEIFTEFTPKLAGLMFGSPEYNECKRQMSVALEHHYANNRHHPDVYALLYVCKNGLIDTYRKNFVILAIGGHFMIGAY